MAPTRQPPPDNSNEGGHRAGPGYVSGLGSPDPRASRPPTKPAGRGAGAKRPTEPRRPSSSGSGKRVRPSDAPSATMPAGKALGAGVIALLVAMLLNSEQLVRDAERKPFGAGRDVSLAVWEPVSDVASAVGLTLPRRAADSALGRDFSDASDAFVVAGGSDEASSSATTTATASDAGAGSTTSQGADSEGGQTDGVAPESTTSSTSTSTTTTTTAAPRVASATEPLDVWVGGDSMAQVFGESFVRLASDTGVIEPELDYRISTGLTRPDFFNWPAHFADVITSGDPEVMVVIFGANDAQGMELSTGVFQPFDEEWVAEYSSRVAFTMNQLTEGSDRLVIWVGQPVMRSGDFDARMNRLNEIYRENALGRDRVVYMDTRGLFSNSAGQYEAYLTALDGEVRNMRQQDGVHLSRAGGDLLADAVIDLLGTYVDLESGKTESTTVTTETTAVGSP